MHSDIGGGYAEPEPANSANHAMNPRQPIRSLNQEVRRIKSGAAKHRLIADGWYIAGCRSSGTYPVLVFFQRVPDFIHRHLTGPGGMAGIHQQESADARFRVKKQ